MNALSRGETRVAESAVWRVLDLMRLGVIVISDRLQVIGTNADGERALNLLDVREISVDDGVRFFAAGPRDELHCAAVHLGEGIIGVLVSDAARRLSPRSEHLQWIYGLTPTEARVVSTLVGGATTQRAAADLHMSINTLRRHLKQVFNKLKVRRQSEMVRVVTTGIAGLNFDAYSPNG